VFGELEKLTHISSNLKSLQKLRNKIADFAIRVPF
jgi:hypothetical protein